LGDRPILSLDDHAFRGRTGLGVTVAVIDSGIHPDHPHVGGVDGGISFVDGVVDHVDRLGHGTAVAAAIREKAPAAGLLSVKVFHDRLSTSAEMLARAIEWSADNGARVINLSLGTRNAAHQARLGEAISRARSRGAIVVSARGSTGEPWYPGGMAGVAGVEIDESLERDQMRVSANTLTFAASPYPRPIPNVPRERNVSGISFAVANVSGFLARALESAGDRSTDDVLRELATPG
jgi:subtilisin family serine protease